MQLLQYRFLSK